MPNSKFWQHYCKIEKDVMSFEKGTECDWCGETEETPTVAKTKTVGEKLYGYHPQELLKSKVLPIDIFYKLFGKKS